MKSKILKRSIVVLLTIVMIVTYPGSTVFATPQPDSADNSVAAAANANPDSDTDEAADAVLPEAEGQNTEDGLDEVVTEEPVIGLTAEDWEAYLPDTISTDAREAMAEIAASQLKADCNLYKAFANAESLDNWDASFVMFVLEYANVLGVSKAIGEDFKGIVKTDELKVPVNADTAEWIKALKEADLFSEINEEANPDLGDIVFLKDGKNANAAVVLDTEENDITVIGAYNNNVRKFKTGADEALGFVSLKELAPAKFADEERAEAAEEAAADENTDADKTDEDTNKDDEADQAKADTDTDKEEAAKAEELSLVDQTLEAKLVSAPGIRGKIKSIFTSDKNAKITLTGYMPEDAYVKAYPVKVDIEGQNVLAAYDITIYAPVLDEDGQPTDEFKEWQPEQAVIVSITNEDIVEAADKASDDTDFRVFHMKDKDANPKQIASTAISGPKDKSNQTGADAVVFDADSFSVYVVAIGVPTVSYRFIGPDGSEYTELRETLTVGQKLYAPVSPSENGRVFKFWTEVTDPSADVDENSSEFTGWGDVTSIPAPQSGEDYPIIHYLKAVYKTEAQLQAVFHDQQQKIIHTELLKKGDTLDPSQISYSAVQLESGKYVTFRYWTRDLYSLDQSGKPTEFTSKTITNDDINAGTIDLYPYCPEAHWLYFDGNKASNDPDRPTSVPYTSPTLVPQGTIPQAVDVPKVNGFTFLGWFKSKDNADTSTKIYNPDGTLVSSNAFETLLYTGGAGLDYDPTLYAHWEANEKASFSVAVYKQRGGDVYDASNPDYHYDFDRMIELNTTPEADVGSSVRLTQVSGDYEIQYTEGSITKSLYNVTDKFDSLFDSNDDKLGFEIDAARSGSVTVNADGTTVFKLYLSRKHYRLIFLDYQLQPNNNGDQTPSNAQLRNSSTAFRTVDTIDALYGQNISSWFDADKPIRQGSSSGARLSNGSYTTNGNKTALAGNSWRDADQSTQRLSGLAKRIDYMPALSAGAEVVTVNGVAAQTEYMVHNSVNADTHQLFYYLEMLDGSGVSASASTSGEEYVTYDGKTFQRLGLGLNYGGGGIDSSNALPINGFTFSAALAKAKNAADSTSAELGQTFTTSDVNDRNVYLFYTRNTHKIRLHYNVDNGAQTGGNEVVSFPYETVIQEADLPKFNLPNTRRLRTDANKNDIFWYNDDSCNDPVDFTNFKMPDYDIDLYEGLKTAYPILIDPNGGELEGEEGNGSTWFTLDKGESPSEYTVTRDYIPAAEANETVETGKGFIYSIAGSSSDKYSTGNGYSSPQYGVNPRTVLYMAAPEGVAGSHIYYPGVYTFQYWYKVTATFNNATQEFEINEKSSDQNTAYNFSQPVSDALVLKAKWVKEGTFAVKYDANTYDGTGENANVVLTARAPQDTERYVSGSQTVVKASKENPVGKVFRFWSTEKQGTASADTYTGTKYMPNEPLIISDSLTNDKTPNKTITLYAWYDDVEAAVDAAEYDFYVADSSGVYHDGKEDVPYYVQLISPNETLVIPKTPADPTGQDRSFIGWYTEKTGGKRFEGFGVVPVPSNLKLYARFSKIYTVTYYNQDPSNPDTRTITQQIYLDGEKLNTIGVECVTDNNHYVLHWTDGTNTYAYQGKSGTFGTDYNGDLELWPALSRIYTVRFDGQGGSYTAPITFPREEGHWVPAPSAPKREGYDFVGWFTEPLDEGEYDPVDPNTGEVIVDGTCGWRYEFNRPFAGIDTQVSGHYAFTKDPNDDGNVNDALTDAPDVLYAHWKRSSSQPTPTTYTINYWVQNPDRDGYILWNTVLDDSDGLYVDAKRSLTAEQKKLSNMAGYYTFAPESANEQDDQSAGYFELSTEANQNNYTDCVSYPTEEGQKVLLEDGKTVFNVYFNRKTFTLKFNPDNSYKLNEVIGGKYETVNLISTHEYDVQPIPYTLNGDVKHKNSSGTEANESVYSLTVWLGMDAKDVWPTGTTVGKDNAGTINIPTNYALTHDGTGNQSTETRLKQNGTYRKIQGHVQGFISGRDNYYIEYPPDREAGYKWVKYSTLSSDAKRDSLTSIYDEAGWKRNFYLYSWSAFKGDGGKSTTQEMLSSTRSDAISTFQDIPQSESIISRKLLVDSNVDTYTLQAQYQYDLPRASVYTSSGMSGSNYNPNAAATQMADSNKVTVHFFLLDSNGKAMEMSQYEQVMYGVTGTNGMTDAEITALGSNNSETNNSWKPTDAEWTAIEQKTNSMVGYSYAGRSSSSSYEVVTTAGGKVVTPLYSYQLPSSPLYYHRAAEKANLAYSQLYLDVNGQSYKAGTSTPAIREGAYELRFNLGLISLAHDDADQVVTFPSGKPHTSRYAEGVSSLEFRTLLETDASQGGYRTFVRNDERTVTNTTKDRHVNLYFEPGYNTLTLRAINNATETDGVITLSEYPEGNANRYNKTASVQFGTYLTNEYGTTGYIKKEFDKYKADNTTGLPEPEAPQGYVFYCWSKSAKTAKPYDGTMPNQPMTLYAHFRPLPYTVTTLGVTKDGKLMRENGSNDGEILLDSNGIPKAWEEGGVDYEAEREYNTRLMEYELPTPVLNSKEVFRGWKRVLYDENGDFKGLAPGYVSDTTRIREDTILTPYIVDNIGGHIEYYANNTGDVSTESPIQRIGGYYLGATVKAKAGTDGTNSSGSALTKAVTDINGANKTVNFVCWNTQADGSGYEYYPGDVIPMPDDPNETLKLYAHYSELREAKVVYHLNVPANTTDTAQFTKLKSSDSGNVDVTGSGNDATVEIVFSDYTESENGVASQGHNKTRPGNDQFPNIELNASEDKDKVAFVPTQSGKTFLKWTTEPGGGGDTILSTDRIRVDKLERGSQTGQTEYHLYAQWEDLMLPVEVYTVWYGNYKDATAQKVTGSNKPYLKDGTDFDPSTDSVWNINEIAVEQTANNNDPLYNAYTRNGLTDGTGDTTKYIFDHAVLNNDDTIVITDVQFDNTPGAQKWQYSTDNATTWNDFGTASLKLYYYPEQIRPTVHYMIDDGTGSLTEVDANLYNIVTSKPDAIDTGDKWVAKADDPADSSLVIDTNFYRKSDVLDRYEFDTFAVGPVDAATNTSDLTTYLYNNGKSKLYLKNTTKGIKYAYSSIGEVFANTDPSEVAIYVIYKAETLGQLDLKVQAKDTLGHEYSYKVEYEEVADSGTFITVHDDVALNIASGSNEATLSPVLDVPMGKKLRIIQTPADTPAKVTYQDGSSQEANYPTTGAEITAASSSSHALATFINDYRWPLTVKVYSYSNGDRAAATEKFALSVPAQDSGYGINPGKAPEDLVADFATDQQKALLNDLIYADAKYASATDATGSETTAVTGVKFTADQSAAINTWKYQTDGSTWADYDGTGIVRLYYYESTVTIDIPIHLVQAEINNAGEVVFTDMDSEFATGITGLSGTGSNHKLSVQVGSTETKKVALDNNGDPVEYRKDGSFKTDTELAKASVNGAASNEWFIAAARYSSGISPAQLANGLLNTAEGVKFGVADDLSGGSVLGNKAIYLVYVPKTVSLDIHYADKNTGTLTQITDTTTPALKGNATTSTMLHYGTTYTDNWYGDPTNAVNDMTHAFRDIKLAMGPNSFTDNESSLFGSLAESVQIRYEWDGIYWSNDGTNWNKLTGTQTDGEGGTHSTVLKADQAALYIAYGERLKYGLTVTNTIDMTGEYSVQDDEFDIVVTLVKEDGNAPSINELNDITINCKKTASANAESASFSIENGTAKATVTLSDTGSAVINNIPAGWKYTVTEPDRKGYDDVTGEVTASTSLTQTTTVDITNKRTSNAIVPSGIANSNNFLILLFLITLLAIGAILSIVHRRRLASKWTR